MGPLTPTGTPHPPHARPSGPSDALPAQRRALMALLARARREELEAALAALAPVPRAHILRAPEVGLVMVRGRAGGEGAPFNLGEATLTRAAVRLDDGAVGISYRLGRAPEAAHAAAILDALWLAQDRRAAVEAALRPVRQRLDGETAETARKTAATKVDFFTLVRGED